MQLVMHQLGRQLLKVRAGDQLPMRLNEPLSLNQLLLQSEMVQTAA